MATPIKLGFLYELLSEIGRLKQLATLKRAALTNGAPISLDVIPEHILIGVKASLPAPGAFGESTFRDVEVPAIGWIRLWFGVDGNPHRRWVPMFAEAIS